MLALSAEEMSHPQPSVVMGGHIGNQSWNRRKVKRSGPPALDRLLFGRFVEAETARVVLDALSFETYTVDELHV